jgi:hypothetical protein
MQYVQKRRREFRTDLKDRERSLAVIIDRLKNLVK